MEVYEAIKKRRSIRRFRSDPVPNEIIMKVLWAGTQAPNAFSRQQWEFIIVDDKQLKMKLAQLRSKIPPQKTALETAPQVLVVCYDNELGMDALASAYSCIENILLALTAEGMGAVTLTARGNSVRDLLYIPEGYDVAALIPMGYPDEDPEKPSRTPVEDKLHINKF